MAKARKGTRKAAPKSAKNAKSAKSAKGAKKKTARRPTRTAAKRASAKELDLGPLKKQIRLHIEKLGKSTSTDRRSQDTLASLQRLQAELTDQCMPTMVVPLA